jgi:hypothetical protein
VKATGFFAQVTRRRSVTPFTTDESKLIKSLNYSQEACLRLKQLTMTSLKRATVVNYDGGLRQLADANAISVSIDRDTAEETVRKSQALFRSLGYRVFASSRTDERGLKSGDEVLLLKTSDPYDVIRLRNTYAYDLSVVDVIARLEKWNSLCGIEVIGAGPDWLTVDFNSLPDDLLSFAYDVYTFCREGFAETDELFERGAQPAWYAKILKEFPQRVNLAYLSQEGQDNSERAAADERRTKIVASGLKYSPRRSFRWD